MARHVVENEEAEDDVYVMPTSINVCRFASVRCRLQIT